MCDVVSCDGGVCVCDVDVDVDADVDVGMESARRRGMAVLHRVDVVVVA